MRCRAQTAQNAAKAGYQKSADAVGGAAESVSGAAKRTKDAASDAAGQLGASLSSYLSWGESKAANAKDISSKSIEASLISTHQCSCIESAEHTYHNG